MTKVLILVDPPISECAEGEKIKYTVYQGGYVDFMPWSYSTKEELIEAAKSGPDRESPFDDLIFYFTQRYKLENRSDLPALIVKKMVASHYMALIEYIKYIISDTERLVRKTGGQLDKKDELSSTESHWEDTFIWCRRISEYCEHIEAALDSLGVDPSNIRIEKYSGNWDNWVDDFRYIYRRMLDLRRRTIELVSSINGLIGIMETKFSQDQAQSSLDEEKFVKRLTILGTLFVPLSFTSGLFSMSQGYAPGGSHFWVYLVVVIPLVMLVFIIVFLSDVTEKRKNSHRIA